MSKPTNPLAKFLPHGLPAKVITFFMTNPDETLTRVDVAEKFSATANSVHSQLKPAVDSGALLRVRNEDGDYIYSPGPTITSAQITTRVERQAPRPPVYVDEEDIAALQAEKGVPLPVTRKQGGCKWDGLFDKLTEPDTSLPVKPEWHSPLLAEASKRNRKGEGHPQYLVRKTGPTTSRIWRTK